MKEYKHRDIDQAGITASADDEPSVSSPYIDYIIKMCSELFHTEITDETKNQYNDDSFWHFSRDG